MGKKGKHTWQPTRDEAYEAARLVCEEGLSGQSIGRDLFPQLKDNTAIARVKRLLQYAYSEGILKFEAETNPDNFEAQLKNIYPHVEFCVVNDARLPDFAARADAVCLQGAKLIAERIRASLQDKGRDRVVVANAGGAGVSNVVRHLASQRVIPEAGSEHLHSISLNKASIPTNFGFSANVLAVKIAEIYHGSHFALTGRWTDEVQKKYDQAVREIDVLVTGVGTRNSLLFRWYEQWGGKLPNDTVGDICLIPIQSEGKAVKLTDDVSSFLSEHLGAWPSLSDLQALAAQGKVVTVIVNFTSNYSKLDIATAVLERGLTSTCVLGVGMARSLIDIHRTRRPHR